jgi:CBS domain containing-hemolysin-like protein
MEYTEPTRDRWQRGPLDEGEDNHREEHDIEDSLRAGHSDGDRNCGEHDGDSAT